MSLKTSAQLSLLSTAAYLQDLNPEQQAAVQAPGHQAVRVLAGAGTGKTELIARRFVKLVEDYQAAGITRPQTRILVVTFTNDAAQNMYKRISEHLIANQQEPLEAFASHVWVSTFHQFALRLVKANTLALGLAPQFGILDTLGQRLLFHRVIDGILAGAYESSSTQPMLTHALTRYQLGDFPSHLLSLSHLQTIGMGQLSELMDPQRLFHIINRIKASGLSPKAFYKETLQQNKTFTETLINLPVKYPDSPGKPDSTVVMETYLSQWQAHLKSWSDTQWQPLQDVRALNPQPKQGDYKKAVEKMAGFFLKYNPSQKIYKPVDHLEEKRQELAELGQLEAHVTQVIAAIYALYQHELAVNNVCDFDDLINHSITLLENSPDLRASYQRQFETIIVDEFQDSSTSQLRLLKLLLKEDATNLTVVGDQKQSIYSFRFAQPENLNLAFSEMASDTPLNHITLKTNYRSTPPILYAANHLSSVLTGSQEQTLAPCEKLSTNTTPTTWVTFGIPTQSISSKGDIKFKTENIGLQQAREAAWIAQEIERLVSTGDYHYKDMAILVKSHTKAERIHQALSAKNIPAIKKKNLGFFQEPVVKNALSLLRLISNPHHELALVRMLETRLNQQQLRQLALARTTQNQLHRNTDAEGRVSLFDILQQLTDNPALCPNFDPTLRLALNHLAQTLLSLKTRHHRMPPAQLLRACGEQIGLIQPGTLEHLKKQDRVHLRTLEKLLTTLTLRQNIQPTLGEILDTVEKYQNDPQLELPVTEAVGCEDAVELMTVHAAKGLEFPVVFVAYCDKASNSAKAADTALYYDPQYTGKGGFGLFLGVDLRQGNLRGKKDTAKKIIYQSIWQTPQHLAEAQRLFYVALTRAKRQLIVTRSDQSADWTAPPHHSTNTVHHVESVLGTPLV